MMTHQDAIIEILFRILTADKDAVIAFSRGNPFAMLMRSYSEYTSDGQYCYQHDRAFQHFRMSMAAYREYQSGKSMKELYQEHRVPLSIIKDRLLRSDRTLDSIKQIMKDNEIVIITKHERDYLDKAVQKGGLGLRSRMPEDGRCRLAYAGIQIVDEHLSGPS